MLDLLRKCPVTWRLLLIEKLHWWLSCCNPWKKMSCDMKSIEDEKLHWWLTSCNTVKWLIHYKTTHLELTTNNLFRGWIYQPLCRHSYLVLFSVNHFAPLPTINEGDAKLTSLVCSTSNSSSTSDSSTEVRDVEFVEKMCCIMASIDGWEAALMIELLQSCEQRCPVTWSPLIVKKMHW